MKKATGDLQFVQQMNRKLILDTLLREAPLSRVEVARRTTLSPSTVASAVSELMADGLIYEVGTVPSTIGRRPILLDVAWDARCVIGLSIYDNQLIGFRTNLRADVRATFKEEFTETSDIVSLVKRAVDKLVDGQVKSTVIGIGISTPGILDRATGGIERSTNFPWDHLQLGKEIQEYTSIPTFLENDTNLSALAERYFGRGRGVDSFAYIHVGSGVGAGLMVDGHILLGNSGKAGEIGHMTIDWKGKPCGCGGQGCLETYVKWKTIYDHLTAMYPRHTRDEDVESVADRALFLAEQYATERARPVIDEAARMLGVGIASLVTVTDPQMVIVEGIYRHCEGWLDVVRSELSHRLSNLTEQLPELSLSDLGDEAPVMGAIAMVLERNDYLEAVSVPRPPDKNAV